MTDFQLYFTLGRDHILDYANGLDHILFIVALCALYLLRDWKQILILVTAFTIGHSITLALSVLRIVTVPSTMVEFLIPLTIFITAASNLFRNEEKMAGPAIQLNYFYALFFGLIHGLGFSNYLHSILGRRSNIIVPLFAFNVGLEVGQLIIVVLFLMLSFILVTIFTVNRRDWKMVLSSAIAAIALVMMKDRIFW